MVSGIAPCYSNVDVQHDFIQGLTWITEMILILHSFAAWMYCPIRMKSEQMMSLTVKSWLPSSKYQFDLMPLSFQDDQNPAFKGELL